MVLFKGLKRGNLFFPCGVMTHICKCHVSCKWPTFSFKLTAKLTIKGEVKHRL